MVVSSGWIAAFLPRLGGDPQSDAHFPLNPIAAASLESE
jgi:hypothetical protein